MLSSSTITAVKEVAPSDIISKYVDLKKHGVNYTSPCPFHTEKSASFTVNDIKGIYKCFGCGASGDAIKFIMENQRQDFLTAVETIANHAGIAIEYDANIDNEKYQAQKEVKASMSKVLDDVIAVYKQNMLQLPSTHPVWQYLQGRGITSDIVIEWNIGWAGTNWRNITPRLINDGNFEHAKAMGIIKTAANESHYDGYRSRIIIPIQNQYGQNIGIAGRFIQIEDADAGKEYPKWINPTENELYNKSSQLFGLNSATKAIKEAGYAWLVEGYFDCIAMHTYGDCNTVASCGTAFTQQQATLLKKYTNHVILLRDNDTAGQKATSKDLQTLIAAGFKCDVGTLPPAFKDCDELIQSLIKTDTNN